MKLFRANLEGGPPHEETIYYDTPSQLRMVYDKPLIVLVNKRSASSSEMLAAALRDHNRAFVVGNQTFGKGTTMSPVAKTKEPDLESNAKDINQKRLESIPEKRLIILGTDYRFYSPKGISHHGQGLSPHITAFEQILPSSDELAKNRESDRFMFPLAATPLPDFISEGTKHMNRLIPTLDCIRDAKIPEYFANLDDAEDEKDMQMLTGAQQVICMYKNLPENVYPQFVLRR